MRMIYVANVRWPTQKAHGVQIAENITEFVKQGVEVTLVVPRRRNPLQTDKSFGYYGLPETRVLRTWTLDWVDLWKPVGFYIQHFTFAVSAFFYVLGQPPETVIYGRDEFVFALIKLFSPARPVFYELHDWPERAFTFWYWFFNHLNGIISTNLWKRGELVNKFAVKAHKILVARNAIRLESFDVLSNRAQLGLPQDRIILGYVGQIQTKGVKKGVEEIIEAVEELKKDFPNIELFIVSKVSHVEIPKYLKAFDILLMPFPNTTHYAYYMSPIKMFEYMAAAKPIITTDLPSIREVLDENSAFFIDNSEPKSIAAAVRKLLAEESLRRKLGENARNLALEHTLDKRVSKILSFIRNV